MLTWDHNHKGIALTGVGGQALLAHPMTAFFASRQCPGVAIRAAMDWALQQAKAGHVVVGGFHSPLEQSVLKVLITARNPVVAVLARPVQGARLPPEWAEPLSQGRMAVVAVAKEAIHTAAGKRLTQNAAALRNAHVAQLASSLVVAHASPGGSLALLLDQWRADGRPVAMFTAG